MSSINTSREDVYAKCWRTVLYFIGLAYCFVGLSAITVRFFRSMENVVKHSRKIVEVDPGTKTEVVKFEKVWNYTIADISLLAFGTSFPQISLATIDAIRNMGSLYAGGLGPGTLVGSAAFDLFPIHAVCVVAPNAGELKRISDVGVWLVELIWSMWAYVWLYIILEVWTPSVITVWEALLTVLQYGLLLIHAYAQDKRWPFLSIPMYSLHIVSKDEWVPEEASSNTYTEEEFRDYQPELRAGDDSQLGVVDIFSIHASDLTDYEKLPVLDEDAESSHRHIHQEEDIPVLALWKLQFVDVLKVEGHKSIEPSSFYLHAAKTCWQLILVPWRFLFAFVPPYKIAHGWTAFLCSLIFISGIAYVVTILTERISDVTGINPYVIAFTALASGTSWPDLVASKIAAERQTTADSAIANITCSNSVNIYVGIGIPWLIDSAYNSLVLKEPLRIKEASGLSFSLLVFFGTSIACIAVLVFRRLTLGAELGGPKHWAWITCFYFLFLWSVFIVLCSLKMTSII